jgi:hypothetical protein
MALEVEGTLFKKFEIEKVKDTFQKREFVIETDEQFPQKIKLEFTQAKCAALNDFNEGDKVKVQFNLRGSEWQGKYFVNLQAWRIEKLSPGKPGSSDSDDEDSGYNSTDYGDDLPF